MGRTNSNVQKRDEQTDRQRDRQTDKKTQRYDPSPTKLGTVIVDLQHVVAPRKLLGV